MQEKEKRNYRRKWPEQNSEDGKAYPSCDVDFFMYFPSFTCCLLALASIFLSSPARSTRLIRLTFEMPKHFDDDSCRIIYTFTKLYEEHNIEQCYQMNRLISWWFLIQLYTFKRNDVHWWKIILFKWLFIRGMLGQLLAYYVEVYDNECIEICYVFIIKKINLLKFVKLLDYLSAKLYLAPRLNYACEHDMGSWALGVYSCYSHLSVR